MGPKIESHYRNTLPYRVNPFLCAAPGPCLCFPWGAHTPCCNDLSAHLSSKLACDLQGHCINSIHLTFCVPSTRPPAKNHDGIERRPFLLQVHFSRLANPLVYSWKHFPTSQIFLKLGSVGNIEISQCIYHLQARR